MSAGGRADLYAGGPLVGIGPGPHMMRVSADRGEAVVELSGTAPAISPMSGAVIG